MKVSKLYYHVFSVIAMISFDPEKHFIVGFFLLFLIFIGIFVIRRWLVIRYDTKSREKAQEKCLEYKKLACTLTNPRPQTKIINGTLVPEGKFPHQVFLRFKIRVDNKEADAECGGSLISEKFILTAANCVTNSGHHDGTVLLGSIDKTTSDTKLWKKVKEIHVHPEYTRLFSLHDISVLELEEKVEFNFDVRPICLNTRFEKRKDPLIVTGWGITDDGNTSSFLKSAPIFLGKEAFMRCRSKLGEERFEAIKPKIICVGNTTTGAKDGDAGGPMQRNLSSACANKNVWEQVGVVSIEMEDSKDQTGDLQIYTKVEFFIPWIVKIVWPETSTIF